jgi:microcystin-dependent protein
MSDPFVGEIRMFGGNYAPVDWALCNGQLLPISEYQPLFALIGTTYGGDGVTTFALPNLQSRIPLHMASSYPLGQAGGVENVALTANQIPVHTHVPQANSVGALTSPTSNFWANSTASQFTTGAPTGVMNANAISSAGNSQPHDNMVPFQVVNFIIALNGLFPTQN